MTMVSNPLTQSKTSPEITPDTTLRDIINTVPKECFEKNELRAWSGVVFSIFAAALGYFLTAIAPWYLLPFAWIFTGTALTGFFVLGHDCGHRSFSKRVWVNDLVGHIMFMPLLFPFHPWRIKHNHHHSHTNKLGEDNAWYPFTTESYAASKGYEQLVYRCIRGRLWWVGSIIHWAVLHFNPSIYKPKERSQVRLSDAVVIGYALIAFPLMFAFGGIMGWVNFFLMPWLVYHFWMSTFTIVHHTMPEIPFHYPDQWHAANDQLKGTVHCDYPVWIEWLCHDINWHIPHHVSTAIPFYNLRKATASLEQNWGDHLYKTKFSWQLMDKISSECHIYDSENCYKSFEDSVV